MVGMPETVGTFLKLAMGLMLPVISVSHCLCLALFPILASPFFGAKGIYVRGILCDINAISTFHWPSSKLVC